MVKYILIIGCLIFSIKGTAQFSSFGNKKADEIKSILKKSTVAVLTGNKEYDSAIMSAMQKYWKITPYEFKSFGKKDKYPKDKNYLALVSISNQRDQYYHFLSFFPGDYGWNYESMLAYCPLDYYGIEEPMELSYHRLPILLFNIQNAVEVILNNKISGNTASIVNSMKQLYLQNSGLIKNKTLLVCNERKKILTPDQFKKVYPYKYEYCSMSKIKEAMNSRDTQYAILWPAATLNKSVFVFDAASFMPLYSANSMMGTGLTESDIRDLTSAIRSNNSSKLKHQFTALETNISNASTSSETDKSENAKSVKSSTSSSPSIANTSAIAHGEAAIPTPSAPKTYKYKADESAVDYYKELRKKFEIEEAARKEKEAELAKEKAKKEEEIKQSRHLSEDQAPQFDRYRQGVTNPPPAKKSTPEEDYNKLFK